MQFAAFFLQPAIEDIKVKLSAGEFSGHTRRGKFNVSAVYGKNRYFRTAIVDLTGIIAPFCICRAKFGKVFIAIRAAVPERRGGAGTGNNRERYKPRTSVLSEKTLNKLTFQQKCQRFFHKESGADAFRSLSVYQTYRTRFCPDLYSSPITFAGFFLVQAAIMAAMTKGLYPASL